MAEPSIGVAVIGAGMAGRSHAFGYRNATTVFDDRLPGVRLVAIADVNQAFAADAARRYGFARAEPSWEAVAAAPDVDAVSVVVGNSLHREVVEGLMAAGKHVLCEKPLADTPQAARAMVEAADGTGLVGAVHGARRPVGGGVGSARHAGPDDRHADRWLSHGLSLCQAYSAGLSTSSTTVRLPSLSAWTQLSATAVVA